MTPTASWLPTLAQAEQCLPHFRHLEGMECPRSGQINGTRWPDHRKAIVARDNALGDIQPHQLSHRRRSPDRTCAWRLRLLRLTGGHGCGRNKDATRQHNDTALSVRARRRASDEPVWMVVYAVVWNAYTVRALPSDPPTHKNTPAKDSLMVIYGQTRRINFPMQDRPPNKQHVQPSKSTGRRLGTLSAAELTKVLALFWETEEQEEPSPPGSGSTGAGRPRTAPPLTSAFPPRVELGLA